ncbi:hypothetical protein D3C87_1293710 [compost metagenome]
MKTCRHHIDQAVVGHDLQFHVRVGFQKPCGQRQHHQFCSLATGGDPEVAGGFVAKAVEVFERIVDVAERRFQSREKTFASLSQADAAGGAVEQAHAQAVFQGAHRMAQGGRRQPQFHRRAAEVQVGGHAQEGREICRRRCFHL